MSVWKPIKTAPKDGTPLLLWLKTPLSRHYVTEGRAPNITIGFNGAGNPDYSPEPRWVSIETEDNGGMGGEMTGWMADWVCVDIDPTHWMRLPKPPPKPPSRRRSEHSK